jgi:cytochrome P450
VSDPEVFNPDRETLPKFATIYFSYCARSCPGQDIAVLELKASLAQFVHQFRFRLLDPQQALELHYAIASKETS